MPSVALRHRKAARELGDVALEVGGQVAVLNEASLEVDQLLTSLRTAMQSGSDRSVRGQWCEWMAGGGGQDDG